MLPHQQERLTKFRDRLDSLPTSPGVYIMHDAKGTIIYVGKAINLRNRVRSYFGSLSGAAPKVERMVSHIAEFEYIVTDTELEALILENQLIKKHKPHYNVRLKDDKTYPYVKVTMHEEWPRVMYTRRLEEDGAKYYGPYANAGAAQTTLDLLNRLFPYRTCDLEIDGKMPRPCLQYYMHRCLGPCAGLANKGEYDDAIRGVTLFLSGRQDKIVRDLQKRMEEAAENLEFERAGFLRDQIRAIEKTNQEQKVFSAVPTDEDVIAFAVDENDACVQIFFVREGKLLGSDRFVLEGAADSSPGEVMRSFVEQFYEDARDIPPNLILQHAVDESDIILTWLKQKRGGKKVTITVPRQGEKRDLVDLVARNAAECVEQMRVRWLTDEQKATAALTDLQEALHLPSWPQRIECYDISHSQGTNTVASMVVFEQGVPAKKEYRRFEIKSAENNDFASMQEVLRRRFRRAGLERAEQAKKQPHLAVGDDDASAAPSLAAIQEETGATVDDTLPNTLLAAQAEAQTEVIANGNGNGASNAAAAAANKETSKDVANWTGWAVLPDLIIIDGGKGQLSAAVEVMNEVSLSDLAIVGLAKQHEEIFKPHQSNSIMLPRGGEALHLVQRVRDEAHRFAIGYHRKLRAKRAFGGGKLDEIAGIGPKRKAALLKQFGSIKKMREASLEEIAQVPGMNLAAAKKLKEGL